MILYRKLNEEKPAHAEESIRLLEWNGGGKNGSGIGIANIDSQGNVHADQFWQDHSFGNVKEKPFSQIWTTSDDSILKGLRDRLPLIQGRCRGCRYFEKICGGGFRARAWHATGDPWASDPACYLDDSEICL